MKLIKPEPLQKGDTIGIFSPAYYTDPNLIKNYADALSHLGYNFYIHPQTNCRAESIGGSVQDRVNALHDLFLNPDIKAIMASTGGYGCIQLLEHIDFDLIKVNPKIIIGYSDITLLSVAIHAMTGLVTFHGPNFQRLAGMLKLPKNIESFTNVLSGETPTYSFDKNTPNGPIVVNPGSATGPMHGGNHILLNSLIGTDFLPVYKDGLFFTESNRPEFTIFDDCLYHLRMANVTKGIKAMIVGEMIGRHYTLTTLSHIRFNENFEQIVKKHFPDTLAITNFPCGHESNLFTFALGIDYTLTATEGGDITLDQNESATQI